MAIRTHLFGGNRLLANLIALLANEKLMLILGGKLCILDRVSTHYNILLEVTVRFPTCYYEFLWLTGLDNKHIEHLILRVPRRSLWTWLKCRIRTITGLFEWNTFFVSSYVLIFFRLLTRDGLWYNLLGWKAVYTSLSLKFCSLINWHIDESVVLQLSGFHGRRYWFLFSHVFFCLWLQRFAILLLCTTTKWYVFFLIKLVVHLLLSFFYLN
jgi:hypothetical protein